MIIKKGTHKSWQCPELIVNKDVISYMVRFDDSCRYNIGPDQGDINKLFGVGYFPHHHRNSVRVGWNYLPQTDKIRLYAYWYNKGVKGWHYMHSVNIGDYVYPSIHINRGTHTIDVQGKRLMIECKGSLGYLLGPYFGGNQTAPHDINLEIRRLK